jgi:endonuclease/exonuclease/phosphatase family metal-dependent hydrolase
MAAVAGCLAMGSLASDLKLATWNLGWHLSAAENDAWIAACSGRFKHDAGADLWRPAADGDKTGWELKWGRDAKIDWDIGKTPPCDVYRARGATVQVSSALHRDRIARIAATLKQINADVYAFQEVSGTAAVAESFGADASSYEFCSSTGGKVQRLAFAWRRSLGAGKCETEVPVSLPARNAVDQVRPGLTLELKVGNKTLRVLTVHLKSSCVSPLESPDPNGRGQLAGSDPACTVLQEQLVPLEAWLTRTAQGADGLVWLGDFNRNLGQEEKMNPVEVRVPPGDPRTPLPQGTRSTSLLREINDGEPSSTRLTLLGTQCDLSPDAARLCDADKERMLLADERRRLAAESGLGCRNPVSLDHVLISASMEAPGNKARKVPLGAEGWTSPGKLALSDHCPSVATVKFRSP